VWAGVGAGASPPARRRRRGEAHGKEGRITSKEGLAFQHAATKQCIPIVLDFKLTGQKGLRQQKSCGHQHLGVAAAMARQVRVQPLTPMLVCGPHWSSDTHTVRCSSTLRLPKTPGSPLSSAKRSYGVRASRGRTFGCLVQSVWRCGAAGEHDTAGRRVGERERESRSPP